MFLLIFALISGGMGQSTIDPDLLVGIFGTPPTSPSPTSATGPQKIEDITVKPTAGITTYRDKDGDECKCVPYYYCDADLNIIDENARKYGGWGELDIRFGSKDECQVSIERCCKAPREKEPDFEIPALKGCGYRNPKGVDFKVVNGNGNEAQYGEFPWVIAILEQTGKYIGVGVLIHPEVVMTGAHIVNDYAPGSVMIRAGEWDTQTTKERLKSQERVVTEIIKRNDFNPNNLKNDIALLRLERPLELASHINVICLPEQNENFENHRQCVANGWGKDIFGNKGRYAVILKKIEIDMVPHADCNNELKQTRLGSRFNLHKSFVCAGGEVGKDTCKGDGGAPLACPIKGSEDRYKLSGLVAWGIGCGTKVPAVYANVAMFRQWVDTVMLQWGLLTDGYKL